MYVCGTSIFRSLEANERILFLERFKKDTGYDFHIISQEDENKFTVMGVVSAINKPVGVIIGGGGSTEISIYDSGIIEQANTAFGVGDIMNKFPDLALDIATTSIEDVMDYVKENLKLPTKKVDTLILAGGTHELFAKKANFGYKNNEIYKDRVAPIMMDIDSRIKDTKDYFNKVSLNKIIEEFGDANWWHYTRAMCALILTVAIHVEAKYIIPTNVGMSYGIIKTLK